MASIFDLSHRSDGPETRQAAASVPVFERLAERLIADGALDAQRLARAQRVAAETGERLDHVLARLGLVDERAMTAALAAVAAAPEIDPASVRIDAALVEALGLKFLKSARALPVEAAAGPTLALADPLERGALDAAALKLRQRVRMAAAPPSEIDAALERLTKAGDLEDGLGPEAGDEGAINADAADMAADVARLRDLASEAPVVRLVNQLIRRAVEARASDIHLEPSDQRLRVRFRIDGVLTEVDAPPAAMRAAVISRVKIMAKLNIAEQRLPQDGRIQIAALGREIDLRVATTPTLQGEGVVMRLLDRAGLVLSFAGLGLDQTAEAALAPLIARPNGIVLVTGPTGSGKTTTLYAAVSQINTPERKIVTIEDPVEYQLPGVSQIQVKPQIGLTFAHGLRSILRQDPDVIMIGEIRDAETAAIAVQAALTGHLVLATLHTNSAAAAIDRLRDMGVEDYLIAATLVGAVAQRLVRRLCPDCAAPADPGIVAAALGDPSADTAGFRDPAGCPACRGSGYRGRSAIVEVLAVDDVIRRAILARQDQSEIAALAAGAGMRSLRRHGLEKAAAGETSLAEALRHGDGV